MSLLLSWLVLQLLLVVAAVSSAGLVRWLDARSGVLLARSLVLACVSLTVLTRLTEPIVHHRLVYLDIADPSSYATYRRNMEPLLAEHGGRFVLDVEGEPTIHGASFQPRRVLLIGFPSGEAAERFFADYTAWIEQMAAASTGADAFAVGTELDKLLQHEDAWRDVIRRVRARYEGPITYAANWTDYDRVPFWDALDAIGVQAYFPLVRRADGVPSDAELDRGWDAVLAGLRRTAARVDKPVVFTELGYNRSSKAAMEPWKYDRGGQDAEAIQEACLRSAFRAMDREPVVVGAFLWKWFPSERPPNDFNKSTARMRATIRESWGAR